MFLDCGETKAREEEKTVSIWCIAPETLLQICWHLCWWDPSRHPSSSPIMNILWVLSMDMDHCYFHGLKSHPNGVYRHASYTIWEPADGKHPLRSLDICVLLQKCFNNRGPAILHPRWSTDDSSCCWPRLPVEQQNGYQNHTRAAWQLPVWKPTLKARTLFGNFLYFQMASGGQRTTPCWGGVSSKGWDEIMRQLMHLLITEGNTKELNVICDFKGMQK